MELIGKTISRIVHMKQSDFDDTHLLKISFTDGTWMWIEGGYTEPWTGNSIGEYPCTISIRKTLTEDEIDHLEMIKEINKV